MIGPVLAVVTSDAVPWFVAAGIAVGVWLVVYLVVLVTSRPERPHGVNETVEPGPEPPAVANFLVNRWNVTGHAVAATLLDLAARRHLAIDEMNPELFLVRLRRQAGSPEPSTGDQLTSYEQKVLGLVRDRASADGTVPLGELSLGQGDVAAPWWKDFVGQVVSDARARGLTRPRVRAATTTLLAAALVGPVALAGVGIEIRDTALRAAGDTRGTDAGGGLAVAFVAWLVLLGVLLPRLRGWRETPDGTTACAHWLGYGRHLAGDDLFGEAPAASVILWDRILAYGVALGMAGGAASQLPLGVESNDHAWSDVTGRWREVRIRYPHRFAYGETPASALVGGVARVIAGGAIVVAVAWFAGPIAVDLFRDLLDDRTAGWIRALVGVGFGAVLAVPAGYGAVVLVKGLVMVVRSVGDLGHDLTVEGKVVRVPVTWVQPDEGSGYWSRTGYLAIDDGSDGDLDAVRWSDATVHEGDLVRMVVTPRLRHVRTLEVVRSRGAVTRSDR